MECQGYVQSLLLTPSLQWEMLYGVISYMCKERPFPEGENTGKILLLIANFPSLKFMPTLPSHLQFRAMLRVWTRMISSTVLRNCPGEWAPGGKRCSFLSEHFLCTFITHSHQFQDDLVCQSPQLWPANISRVKTGPHSSLHLQCLARVGD